MPKNSYLIQFNEINICQIMIFRLYTVNNTHQIKKKLAMKPEKNRKYYCKCSNNFSIDCRLRVQVGYPNGGSSSNSKKKIARTYLLTSFMGESETTGNNPLIRHNQLFNRQIILFCPIVTSTKNHATLSLVHVVSSACWLFCEEIG